jgi:hypothetical protein
MFARTLRKLFRRNPTFRHGDYRVTIDHDHHLVAPIVASISQSKGIHQNGSTTHVSSRFFEDVARNAQANLARHMGSRMRPDLLQTASDAVRCRSLNPVLMNVLTAQSLARRGLDASVVTFMPREGGDEPMYMVHTSGRYIDPVTGMVHPPDHVLSIAKRTPNELLRVIFKARELPDDSLRVEPFEPLVPARKLAA